MVIIPVVKFIEYPKSTIGAVLNGTGAPRTFLSGRVDTDPAGGSSFSAIPGSITSDYIRE
jgi:hypothetical protein